MYMQKMMYWQKGTQQKVYNSKKTELFLEIFSKSPKKQAF